MLHIQVPSFFLDNGEHTSSPIGRNWPNRCSARADTASPAAAGGRGRQATGQWHFRSPGGGGGNVHSQQHSGNVGRWFETFQKATKNQAGTAALATAAAGASPGPSSASVADFVAVSAKSGKVNGQPQTPGHALGKGRESHQKVAKVPEVEASVVVASSKAGNPAQTSSTHVFRQRFDLKSFTRAEITVKMDGSTLVVQGKHEGPAGEDGTYECREYLKKVPIPENVLVEQMICQLDETDGHLLMEAPLKKATEVKGNVWTIPIQFVAPKAAKNQDQEDTVADHAPNRPHSDHWFV